MKSSSSDFLVKTASGKSLPRNKCRYIGKEYHEIGVDCFLMPDDRWHRKNNGKIEFDHEINNYVLLDRVNLARGYVGIDKNNGLITGYFSPNPYNNVIVNNTPCISDKIPEELEMEEAISSGSFYTKGQLSKSELTRKGINGHYSFRLDYSASSKLDSFKEHYAKAHTEDRTRNCKFSNELGNTTWGIEFETSNGFIRENHLYKLGLIPLRDGSLRHDGIEPFEYTTIPLSGNDGINTTIDTVKILKKYTEIGHQCALHVHIGGYTPSYELLVAFHRIMIRTQDEIFSMFPSNYKFTSDNGFKQKDYCAPIKNIRLSKNSSVKDNFLAIFNHYCENNASFRGFGVENHPMDRNNQAKWHVQPRRHYCAII